ncbi:hypothetical protein NDU88_005849 [Pleurodeles waltl]|uniref:Uncharacterized protein n=1 Tax=Pleurodeles waltl TaxID=8319 RepID=A0AAV7VNU3_PLEWA|nr:hypothetical protein NDU88_005849 [Pleurodeles waltl]
MFFRGRSHRAPVVRWRGVPDRRQCVPSANPEKEMPKEEDGTNAEKEDGKEVPGETWLAEVRGPPALLPHSALAVIRIQDLTKNRKRRNNESSNPIRRKEGQYKTNSNKKTKRDYWISASRA